MGNNERAKNRPLPKSCPELIPVEIHRSEYKGRTQWVTSYPVYNNGKDSDWVKIVINFTRSTWRFEDRLEDGQRVWVRPTSMAPQARLIFAEFEDLDRWNVKEVFPHHVGDEIDVAFRWFPEGDCYVHDSEDGWSIRMNRTSLRLAEGEMWKVRINRIRVGAVTVEPVGLSDQHAAVSLPEQLAYLQVKSLYGKPVAFEGDVMAYCRLSLTAEVVVETDDDVIVFSISDLRQPSRSDVRILGTFTRDGQRHGQLCELVWIEGSPASAESVWTYQQQRRRQARPTSREREEDRALARLQAIEEDEAAQQIEADYLAEIRYNSERPDYD